jgi:hypothetical protein
MSRTRIAALALAATTLAASGCGESSKTTTSTRAEFIAKADAICGRVNARRASTHIRTHQDFVRLIPPLAAYEQTAITELGKLTAPASMANDWRQIVAGDQTITNDTAKLGEYETSKNFAAARALIATSSQAQVQMMATAKRDGFSDCAQLS